MKGQNKESGQESGSNVNASKKNHFYALRFKGEQETFPAWVTCLLKVFSIDVYSLLDLGATLSFLTPLEAKKFDILPNILNKPFMISTPVGESWLQKERMEIVL